jgi:hypothetical protein
MLSWCKYKAGKLAAGGSAVKKQTVCFFCERITGSVKR